MAIKTFRNSGFIGIKALMTDLLNKIAPESGGAFKKIENSQAPQTPNKILLEATSLINGLAGTQDWRLYLEWQDMTFPTEESVVFSPECIKAVVASPTQLESLTKIAKKRVLEDGGVENNGYDSTYYYDYAGSIGNNTDIIPSTSLTLPNLTKLYVEKNTEDVLRYKNLHLRLFTEQSQLKTYPLGYICSINSQGIMLYIYEEGSEDQKSRFSWLLVQHGVDHKTGTPNITGKAPVWCVYSCGITEPFIMTTLQSPVVINYPNSTNQPIFSNFASPIRKFVVREADITTPTRSVPACYNTADSSAIMNELKQVSIDENKNYTLTFPNKLNTPRYAYTDELDLLAYISADVISEGTEVSITVYNEETPRKYLALNANSEYNTGMRILMQIENTVPGG